MDRLTFNLVQDLQRAGQCGRFHSGRSEIPKKLFEQFSNFDSTGWQNRQYGTDSTGWLTFWAHLLWMSLTLFKQAKCGCWHLTSSNPGRALHGSGRGSWRGEDHRDSEQVENIFFSDQIRTRFSLIWQFEIYVISISIFQILWSEDDVAPKCLPVQSSSKPQKCECYLPTGTSVCLLKKASVFERQATYVPKKSSLPWTSLFITLVKYQDISRFPYQIFEYLDIFGCQDIPMSTYTSPAALWSSRCCPSVIFIVNPWMNI